MEYKAGYVYHIKSEYFDSADDDKLMKNKENGRYRPTYYCMDDKQSPIIWVIPMSSQVEKYRSICDKQIKKYGKSNGIYIDRFDGKDSVFLIQNMFPILPSYISHIHTRNGIPVEMNEKTKAEVEKRAKKALALHKKGIRSVFTDIGRLKEQMLDEYNSEQELYDEYEDEYSKGR